MNSKTEIPYSLVLHPTPQEFANFGEFWEKVEQDPNTQKYGIIKVVPPAKWAPRDVPIAKEMDDLMVNSPIEQNVLGQANISGIYELQLMQKKSMTIRDYRKKVEIFDKFTNNKSPDEVESLFWKNIGFSQPLYGADIPGSLFDDGVKWNPRELNGVLKEGLNHSISGVNKPYLYVGSWKTMFGWHKEDMDLYSINFLHYGKPKFWYCIPTSEGPKLEKFVKRYFPEAFSKCKEYLRHKTIMISPYLLKQQIPDLKIHKMIHHPGEFIVTLGGAYHLGFNWGFNLAESVNFATTRWLDLFPLADCCRCIKDSVKIDKNEFYKKLATSSYSEHPTVKKYIEDHSIEINLTEKTQQSSTSTTKIKSTRSHHPLHDDEENAHSPKGKVSKRNGNAKDAMVDEDDEMTTETSAPSNGRVTRSTVSSKKERQSKMANKIVESSSKKNKNKSDSSDETPQKSDEDDAVVKTTSNLHSKSKKIHKKAIETKRKVLQNSRGKEDSHQNIENNSTLNAISIYPHNQMNQMQDHPKRRIKMSQKRRSLFGRSAICVPNGEKFPIVHRFAIDNPINAFLTEKLLKRIKEKHKYSCSQSGITCDRAEENSQDYEPL